MLYCTVHAVKTFCRIKYSAVCTVTLSLSPIYCNLQFTQSKLFVVPNTPNSVLFRSHCPRYPVFYSSISRNSFPYQTLCFLYSTTLSLLYILYCTVHSDTLHCCTKHSALCKFPLSLSPIFSIVLFTQSHPFAVSNTVISTFRNISPIYSIVQFTQSQIFAVPITLLSVQHRSHSPLYTLLYSSLRFTSLPYQILCSLYITDHTLHLLIYCTVHSVTKLCHTKQCALCTVTLSLPYIFYYTFR
jgi:hypothetical protein